MGKINYSELFNRIHDPEQKKIRKERLQKYKKQQGRCLRLARYGLTEDTYSQMLQQQDNRCGICSVDLLDGGNSANSPVVDHCHTSGKVRAILCSNCNKALGLFKDNVEVLAKSIAYLNSFK